MTNVADCPAKSTPRLMLQQPKDTMKSRNKAIIVSPKWIVVFCIFSFALGILFSNRLWAPSEWDDPIVSLRRRQQELAIDSKREKDKEDVLRGYKEAQEAIKSLDNSIAKLRLELPSARDVDQMGKSENLPALGTDSNGKSKREKAFIVIGINTAFSSRKRRDSVRETWMPQGEKLVQLEHEKGIFIRFMIGHSATSNSILDRAIDLEEQQHNDILRLEHVEGYHELSAKTKAFFSTAVAKWDADFYVKIDDDVHVNLGTLAATLARHRSKPRVYIGCMKSGPVLYQKDVKYHEPEHWKFGEEGNRYFRHATGQIYAISQELATYISVNRPILHKYANEDVSLGAWLIGLEVEHINDHNMCCRTPHECEWKAQSGSACVASFDWRCSGICSSVERIKEVHTRCGEDPATLWSVLL
ncbi:beta-1,3-galactosyltransferase 7-like isoform X2 [Coffea arabica]|uniref:Hexosyltransferase n=1 Tax=Coffea arabica TaxID=13443 RepID=A0A6P6TI24_COFAR|nr:beta-1,3-galactosyltransferase 7-like isoform X2 [Coffea arabica]